MKKDRILLWTAALFYGGILLADAALPERLFSETENRRLAQRPELQIRNVIDGSYGKNYEEYVADQFPWRDGWIVLMAGTERVTGKKDVNGVYFSPGNTLVEMHTPEMVNEEKAERKAARLLLEARAVKQEIEGDVGIMPVPSTAAVQADRLPAFAVEFDQAGWLARLKNGAGEAGVLYVDVFAALKSHADEKIYYGTDHHWTTLGAFYGWQAMEKTFGRSAPALTEYDRTAVTDSFYGTLQAKVNLPAAADTIEIFERRGEGAHPVSFIFENRTADSCYFYERLKTGDPYAFFLDGNAPLIELEGDGPADAEILVVKDSFANCFVPFLTREYGRIWILDKRYYRSGVKTPVRELKPKDVLYLYSVFGLVDNF